MPAEGRGMREEVRSAQGDGPLRVGDKWAEHERVVVDHDRGQEVEAGGPDGLAIAATVTNLAFPIEAQGTLQRVVRLAFVQADLLPALQGRVDQPGENEDRAFDAADLAQRDGQGVALWRGSELAQEVARHHDAGDHGS